MISGQGKKYIRKNETYSENKNKTYILRGELRG